MLAYSGKGKFVVEPVDLSQLVEEMARLMAVSISKKVKLRREFGENIPAVEADSSQVRQVVMNLITNASEAVGDASGSITIRTGVAGTGHRFHDAASGYTRVTEAPHVFIEVSDTGCGMDRETEAKLFEPFFTTKFTGRGLGLAAVLGIVRGHSGGIHVRSKPGAGSTFRVLFPASGVEPNRPVPASRREPDWKGEGLVLVVDDEDSVREMGERMLGRMGFKVITARDGGEAIQLIEEHASAIRLVLLDLTMPYLDGKETLREIRELRPTTQVIMTSGYNEQEISNRFQDCEVAGFLQKPYRYGELVELVQAALSAGDEEPVLRRTAIR
jgi:CheY-like chemotaxis protein